MNNEKIFKFVKWFFYYGAVAINILLLLGVVKIFPCISEYSQWIIYSILGILVLLLLIAGIFFRQKITGKALKIILYWVISIVVFYCINLLAAKSCMPLYYGE